MIGLRFKPVFLCLVVLAGCATPQRHSSTQIQAATLPAEILRASKTAFITPSTITGQEEDKQALALSFTEVLRKQRPDLRIIPLPETLSAINRAGLTRDYKRMFEDYALTGIFDRETLHKVGDVTGARYIAQLKLSGFRQESKGRWGSFGLRILETKSTAIRLFLQVWDSEEGSVVWEGAQELTFAHDSIAEDTVTFRSAVEESARDLITRLP